MGLRFEFTLGERGSLIAVDGREVTQAIYTRSIGMGASQIATLRGVREVLVNKQRVLAQGRGIVMDGRDIGTVVFPQADVKFYLDAAPEVRGERRWRELQAQGERVSLAEVIAEIRRRDHEDRTREVSPLRVPEGAYCIDTTHLSIDEVFASMVDKINFSGISFCDADLRLERDACGRPHP
jgi:cytidylate kinase